MMANNYEYSKQLLALALKQRVPFIYASSAAVYGTGENGFREEPKCENPMNVYAYSKLAFDNWVRRHLGSFSTPVVGFRYFNVYGPQENHKGDMASVAYKLFEQRAASKALGLFEGSDDILRDFVYVEDCVAVNLAFFERPESGVFNVGTGKARSFGDVGRIAVSLVGGEVQHIPMPDHLRGKYQRFTQADLTRLRAAGYSAPFVELEDGMKRYYESLAQRGGYLSAPS
jgi:ADP-L-glycero-D-manno-heptose 6-epimerase